MALDDKLDQISQSKDNMLHKLEGTIEDNVLFDSNVKNPNRESLKKEIQANYGLNPSKKEPTLRNNRQPVSQ